MHIKKHYLFAQEFDRRANFLTEGPIYLVNNQSCQTLVLAMYQKYKESREYIQMANADIPTFRPNIVIDEEFDEPYCEDEFIEMRIANIMLRQIGPRAISDKFCSINWRTNTRHPTSEPYTIITQTRKHHKWGPIFGTILQPDIIETKQQFNELLPDYKAVTDRSMGPVGIIKKDDDIMVRVRKRKYYLT